MAVKWARTSTKTQVTCRIVAITDNPKAIHVWRVDGKFEITTLQDCL